MGISQFSIVGISHTYIRREKGREPFGPLVVRCVARHKSTYFSTGLPFFGTSVNSAKVPPESGRVRMDAHIRQPSLNNSANTAASRNARGNIGGLEQEPVVPPFVAFSAACLASGVLFVVVFVLQGKATLETTTLNITDWPTQLQSSHADDENTGETTPLEIKVPFEDIECDNDDCTALSTWLSQWIRRDADPCDDFYEYVCGNMLGPPLLSHVANAILSELEVQMKFRRRNRTHGSVIEAAGLVREMCIRFNHGANRDDASAVKDSIKFLGIDFSVRYADIYDSLPYLMVFLSTTYDIHSFVALKERRPYHVPADKPNDSVVEIALDKKTTVYLLDWNPHEDPEYGATYFSDILKKYTHLEKHKVATVASELQTAMGEAHRFILPLNSRSAEPGRRRLMTLSEIFQRKNGCMSKDKWEFALWDRLDLKGEKQDYLYLVDLHALDVICYLQSDTSNPGRAMKLFAWFALLYLVFPSRYADIWRIGKFTPISTPSIPEEICARAALSGRLGVAARMMLYQSRVSSESLAAADQIRQSVFSTLASHLASGSSIVKSDEEAVSAITVTMGFPDETVKYINEHLRQFKFNFDANGYLASLSAVWTVKWWPLLWLDYDAAARMTESGATNALYDGPRRHIYLPPGLLSSPLLYAKGSPAYNYGIFGNILATELLGLLYIYNNGTMKSATDPYSKMWNQQARHHFESITRCLLHQEKEHAPFSRHLWTREAPKVSLINHIATWLSYKAYQSSAASAKHRWTPAYLQLTSEQLFFVSHCVPWCSDKKEDLAARQRCVQPLLNMPEFAEAFRCGSNDRMFSSSKCPFL
ncbi:membrane metallo-endopeptidase-like 1 [Dermacentor albipictus]|uniref:membrane metallo-endopeptidase-like 1 n=1 Tax=Dermacentor albipictus TaxID=60249 RepID=UPI0031FD2937